MKSKATSSKEICWGPTIYFSKQNKTKLKIKTTDALRKMHNA
jgi:hypothetical protein